VPRCERRAGRVATAAPVWHELQSGRLALAAGKRRRAIEAMLDAMARSLVILPYGVDAAEWHAHERARLSWLGKPAPFVDGQIAAIAAASRLVLVTRNVRDFSGFTAVRVESWFSA
jgi:tRNA(fMet)-specific endonuclease VapC